jgi:hypothetical protein
MRRHGEPRFRFPVGLFILIGLNGDWTQNGAVYNKDSPLYGQCHRVPCWIGFGVSHSVHDDSLTHHRNATPTAKNSVA